MLRMRFFGSAIFGALLTLCVFYLMHSLVARADVRPSPTEPQTDIHFGPIDLPEPPLRTIRPPPPERPKPQQTPPSPTAPQPEPAVVDITLPDFEFPTITEGTVFTKYKPGPLPQGSSGDGSLILLVYSAPLFPQEAVIKGLEGWVKLEFTVGTDGRVSDVRVLEAMPARVFNQSAIQAVLKWRFKPEQDNGQLKQRRVVQQIDFTLPKA